MPRFPVLRPERSVATATRLSCALPLSLVLTCVGSIARATEPWSPPAPPPWTLDLAQSRHQVGVQLGGSAVFQVVYRSPGLGPFHLEVGLAGLPEIGPVNGSLGTLIAFPLANRWLPYLGLGAGTLAISNGTASDRAGTNDVFRYGSARIGLGVALGAQRRHLLSFDVGFWAGAHLVTHVDDAGNVTNVSSRFFIWPMFGLSYFYAAS